MNDTLVISAMGTLIVLAFGVAWGLVRAEVTDLKKDVAELKKENASLRADAARSDERDKAFEAGITRLTKAIDDFDTRIGAQIERLSRVVEDSMRKLSPPPRSYYGAPLKREDDK